jgi:uncharacterized protein YbjT (DUF2867 family)
MTEWYYLVVGATGGTGRRVVSELAERKLPVRALVHTLDERSDRLSVLGAEIVRGDLMDVDSIRSAVDGVRRAYFCFPPKDGLLEATINFATVAKEARLEAVVNLSQYHARAAHPSSLTRQHWLGERVLDVAGVGATHLRANFFAENYLVTSRDSIAGARKFFLPYGEGLQVPVTTADIARVAVGILAQPEKYAGKVLKVTGPTAMSQSEIADVFTAALGRKIEYVDLPAEAWRSAAKNFGFPNFLLDHFCAAAEDCKRGLFAEATNIVQEIGGAPPQSFADFAIQNAELFGGGGQRQAS